MTGLSSKQIAGLMGVVDALLPSLPPEPSQTSSTFNSTNSSNGENNYIEEQEGATEDLSIKEDAVRTFWQHDLTQDKDFRSSILKAIQEKLDPAKRSDTCLLLDILSSAIGCWLLFFPSVDLVPSGHPFAEWDREKRQMALKSLQQSSMWRKRMVFNGLKRLICGIAMSYVPENETSNGADSVRHMRNPFWAAMGYGGPYHWGISPQLDEQMIQESVRQDVHISRSSWQTGDPFDYLKSGSILQIPQNGSYDEMEFDCIVIVS